MNITTKYLTPNPHSRPQKAMPKNKVRGVVIHWIASAMGSPQGVWNFWENRKNGKGGYGGAHEVIGLKGEVLVAVPHTEYTYAVGSNTYTKEALKKLGSYPNNSTYNIECCHIDMEGKMTPETIQSLIKRATYWCKYFGLNPLEDLWLHKEVVGWKDCHRWYVNHPQDWAKFKQDVYNEMYPQPKQHTKEEIIMTTFSKYFNDEVPKWIAEHADELKEKGILNGKKIENGDVILDWNAPITRGEVTVLLNKAIEYALAEAKKVK